MRIFKDAMGNQRGNQFLYISALMLLTLTLIPTLCIAADNISNSGIKQLAVMPFISVDNSTRQSKDLKRTLDCELSGLCTIEQDTLLPAEQALTRQLRQALAETHGEVLLPQAQVTQRYLTMTKKAKETPRDIGIRLGDEMGVDQVMVGLIWRYQERVGGTLAAKRPASVSFDLFLLDVASKTLLWQGSFSKTQQALSDNLFDAALFFNSGVKWLSAEELAAYGMKVTLRTMPQL